MPKHTGRLNALIRKLLHDHTTPAGTWINSIIENVESARGLSGGKRLHRTELQRDARS